MTRHVIRWSTRIWYRILLQRFCLEATKEFLQGSCIKMRSPKMLVRRNTLQKQYFTETWNKDLAKTSLIESLYKHLTYTKLSYNDLAKRPSLQIVRQELQRSSARISARISNRHHLNLDIFYKVLVQRPRANSYSDRFRAVMSFSTPLLV